MTTQNWLMDLLAGSGFVKRGRVIAYIQRTSRVQPENPIAGTIGTMNESDLPEVEQVDHAAFSPPWQMDSDALRATRKRSQSAFVLRLENRIAGYLMAGVVPHGIHITRVAVRPEDQNKGVGRALVIHLLNYFYRQGAPKITVNTQIENRRSQQLYRSLGFLEMGESYPVFRYDLPAGKKPML